MAKRPGTKRGTRKRAARAPKRKTKRPGARRSKRRREDPAFREAAATAAYNPFAMREAEASADLAGAHANETDDETLPSDVERAPFEDLDPPGSVLERERGN